jgi:hypothetical protein
VATPIYLDNVSGKIQTGVNNTATAIPLQTGQGAAFGSVASGRYIPAVVVDTSTSPETVKEFLHVTGVAGDVLTVNRAAEDASTYPAGALSPGWTIAAVVTTGSLADLLAGYDVAGSAAAAQTAAEGYTDTQVASEAAARAAADTAVAAAAATDATTKANAAQAAAIAASQPLDSDLTAIAALTTTSFGRALLALADAAAGRTALGLGTAATQASSAFDAAGAAAAAQAASQPVDSDLTAIAALTTTSYGRAFLALADAAAAKTALALVKGDVGLGSVDNTSDVNKPVSTAQQTALDAKAQKLTRTAVKTANYTAAAGDLVPVDTTSGAVTVTLPNAPAVGSRVAVKLVTLGAGNVVTIACAGSDVFNKTAGPTSGTLTLLNQALQVQYDTGGIWTVVADDIPKSQLDATFIAGYPLPASNGVDDAAAINTILSSVGAAAGGTVRGRSGETYKVSTALVVPSGVHLDMTKCAVAPTAGFTGNMVKNAGAVPAATDAAAAIASGSAIVTTTLPGVVGQTVVIDGAGGHATDPGPLVANVTAVGSGTLTLSKTAVATVVAGKASLHTRDSNVRVTGGYWNRGNKASNGAPYAAPLAGNVGGYNMLFRHVDGLTVEAIRHNNTTAASYCVSVGDCTDVLADDLRGTSTSDGIHLNGPVAHATIRRVSMITGDDGVAATGRDYANAEDTCGDITSLRIEDTHLLTGSAARVLLLAGLGTTIRDVLVDGIYGSTTQPVFSIIDDANRAATAGGTYDRITVRGVKAATTASSLVKLAATGVRNLRFEDVPVDATLCASLSAVFQTSGCNIESLSIHGMDVESLPAGCPIVGNGTGTIGRLAIRGLRANFNDGNQGVLTTGAGSITKFILSDVEIDDSAGAQIVYAPTAGTTLTAVEISNLIGAGLGWVADINTTTAMHLNGVHLTGQRAGWFNLRASANLNVYAGSTKTDKPDIGTAAGYQLGADGSTFHVDVSKLNSPAEGYIVTNSNAGLSCGAGAVVWHSGGTGNGWKHLYTAATY